MLHGALSAREKRKTPVLGAIEISPDCTSGRVFLVLDGITAQVVDRILDPVVATMPLSVSCVLYISITDGNKLLDAIEDEPAICTAGHLFRHFVVTPGYRLTLRILVVPAHDANDADNDDQEPRRLDVCCAPLLRPQVTCRSTRSVALKTATYCTLWRRAGGNFT